MFLVIHYTIDMNCRDKTTKITYLLDGESRNQLRRCNVPPNHMPTCSSISQQCCHPRAGHDSSKDKGQCRLTHSQGTQSANQHHWVYPAFNNRPSQHSLKTNHYIPQQHNPFTALWRSKGNQWQSQTKSETQLKTTRKFRVVLVPNVAKTTQLQPKPRSFSRHKYIMNYSSNP